MNYPLYTVTLANSVDPEEMLQNATFDQGQRCLLTSKYIQSSGTEAHFNLESLTCDP